MKHIFFCLQFCALVCCQRSLTNFCDKIPGYSRLKRYSNLIRSTYNLAFMIAEKIAHITLNNNVSHTQCDLPKVHI